ncbi:MAG: OmpH family outer membrane protein [Dinghuibacter sp.]|nr:OmpH family outer membrane protein [Dinghuibacter sp.]
MSKLNWIVNGILLLAIGGLYYLYFTGKKNGGETVVAQRRVLDTSTAGSAYRIAYFDIDSITNNYQYCIDVKENLDAFREETEKKIAAKQSEFDLAYGRLQEKATAQKLTDAELQKEKMLLEEMQQAVAMEKEKGTAAYEQKRKIFELEIKNDIVDFIRRYNTPQRFAFILADEPGIFYYRDSLYNITNEVLLGLNKRYRRK